MKRLCGLVLSGLLLLAACDTADPDTFKSQYVVESYQVASEPLGTVRLFQTEQPNVAFDLNELAVRDAEVLIELLDEAGAEAVETYVYEEVPGQPGLYEAIDEDAVVQERRTYRLRVEIPETNDQSGGSLSATTLVPGVFEVLSVENADVTFQDSLGLQPQFRVTLSETPGRQSYYIFSTESLLPEPLNEDDLVPFLDDILDEDEKTPDELEDFRLSSSPILNQENYDIEPDSTVVIDFPWIAATFYGRNHVSVSALDDNLYDLIRSQSVQQGGSTLAPGEIPNIIERIEGGTGVFGSYARVSEEITIRCNPVLDTPGYDENCPDR